MIHLDHEKIGRTVRVNADECEGYCLGAVKEGDTGTIESFNVCDEYHGYAVGVRFPSLDGYYIDPSHLDLVD